MKNNWILNVIGMLLLAVAISCSDNDDLMSRGQLKISAGSSLEEVSAKGIASKDVNADLSLSSFWINITEFELELDLEDDDYQEDENEDWDDDGYYDSEDEIELEGPFEVDLLAGQVELLNVSVPMGNFEELEFEFEKSGNPESDLFGKSIMIEGSIQGTPFVFWHDFNEEVEVDFEEATQNITITGGTESIVINFDLTQIFNSAFGVDLSAATDNNQDGLIEISPVDEDGNNDLAQALKEAIKMHIDLLDD